MFLDLLYHSMHSVLGLEPDLLLILRQLVLLRGLLNKFVYLLDNLMESFLLNLLSNLLDNLSLLLDRLEDSMGDDVVHDHLSLHLHASFSHQNTFFSFDR